MKAKMFQPMKANWKGEISYIIWRFLTGHTTTSRTTCPSTMRILHGKKSAPLKHNSVLLGLEKKAHKLRFTSSIPRNTATIATSRQLDSQMALLKMQSEVVVLESTESIQEEVKIFLAISLCSTNFKTEWEAIKTAAAPAECSAGTSSRAVFFTDALSILQAL